MEEEEAAGAASLAEAPSIGPLSTLFNTTAPLVAHVEPSVGAKPQSPILSPATYTSSDEEGEQAAAAHSRSNSSDSSSAVPSRLRDSDDDKDDDFELSSDASDF